MWMAKLLWGTIFVVFVEGSIHESSTFVWIMKENITTTNFEPQECFILVQSTKIGHHEK